MIRSADGPEIEDLSEFLREVGADASAPRTILRRYLESRSGSEVGWKPRSIGLMEGLDPVAEHEIRTGVEGTGPGMGDLPGPRRTLSGNAFEVAAFEVAGCFRGRRHRVHGSGLQRPTRIRHHRSTLTDGDG